MLRAKSVSLRRESSNTNRPKVRPLVELLEDRTLPAGLYYMASGVKVDLIAQSNQYAIKIAGSNSDQILKNLTTSTGPLAGYAVKESIAPNVWRLEATASSRQAPAPIDTSHFSAPGVSWITSSFVNAQNQVRVLVIDEMIVGLRAGVNPNQYFSKLSQALGIVNYRPILGTPDQYVVTLKDKTGQATLDAANQLASDSQLTFAAPNLYQNMQRFFLPDDPLFPNQWHLNNTGQVTDALPGADVKAVNAWNVSTGTGVTIAVVDDGIERTHPDLAPNIFVNPGEIAGNGIDDDGNGYIDDVSGWSFVTNGPNPSVTSNDEHGTSVSGVAAGKGNNNLGVTGAAFNAKILPVQIFNGPTFVGEAGAASAIYYAAGRTANGLGTWNAAQVINCSWGGGSPSTVITDAFTWASNTARAGKGVATFISSGNGYASSVSYPANLSSTLSGVMAVGASNQRDLRSEYSNYGTALDFVAPSSDIDAPFTVGITTTDRTGSLGYNTGDYTNNTVANGFGGTSSASPLAAGIGALLLSVNPNLTAAQVKSTLRATADKVGGVVYDGSGFNLQYGYGRLNAFAAIQTLTMQVAATTPANGAVVSTPPASIGGYLVDFNFAYDPSNIDISKVHVNGVSPTSFTVIDTDTLQFNFSVNPVTGQGLQTYVVDAGAVRRLSNGELVGAYNGSFRYDILSLAVVSTNPPAVTGVFTLPGPFTYDVNFNEVIDPSSVQTTDLVLSGIPGAAVTGVTVLPGNTTARFTISGMTQEGTLSANIAANSITDVFGNGGLPFASTYQVDFGVVAYPTPLTPKNPLGSLIYDPSISGTVNFAGDLDSFTLNIDANQTLSVIIRPTNGTLQPRVELFDPINSSMVFASAPAAGQITGIQTIAISAAGTYRIQVSGVAGSIGDYTVEVSLNAAFELEGNVVGASNNTLATAQNLNGSFIGLQTLLASANRGAVLGTSDNANYSASAVAFVFENISSTGTLVSGLTSQDDTSVSVPVGFSFPFYGTSNTTVFVSSNGLLSFGTGNSGFTNADLTTTPAQASIAPFWDDLHTAGGVSGSNVFTQVIGSGANQHLTIQWNNIRFFSGGTTGDTITFQAQLYADGRIQFNYLDLVSGTAAGNNGASATVGIKAAGTQGSDRLLLAFNNGPNAFVGTGLSTLISPPSATPDYYSFSLTAGQSVNVALTALTPTSMSVELRNSSDAVLATGVGGFTNVTSMISNFVAGSTGTYYLRVTGAAAVPYSLVVGNDTAIDGEANDTLATAQNIGNNKGVLGAISSSTSLVYSPNVLTYGFEDISSSGTAISDLSDADDASVSIPIGFNFNFYNTTQTSVFVSSNGLMTFGGGDSAFTNGDLTTSTSLAGIAPFWDDLIVTGDSNSNVFYQVLGSGATQRLVVQWNQVSFFSGGNAGDTITFQAVLYAVDGTVRFNYADLTSGTAAGNNGGSATVGIKAAGTQGPNRFLLAFNNGPNTFVGTSKSTSLTLPPAEDWYSFTVPANKMLRVDTSTPGDGDGEPQVLLDPHIELYDPNGVLMAVGSPYGDGRNEIIKIVKTTLAGTYRVRVSGENNSTGVYFLGVTVSTPVRGAATFNPPPSDMSSIAQAIISTSSKSSTLLEKSATSKIYQGDTSLFDNLSTTLSRTPTFDQAALNSFFEAGNVKTSNAPTSLDELLVDQLMLRFKLLA